MRPPDVQFIRQCAKRYYFERFNQIEIPTDMAKREFGYRRADSGMIRHIQIHTAADLRILLLQAVPLEMYVSNARYLFPDQPMPKKVWKDAHLIFDIDAKDLDAECRPSHTIQSCRRCGHVTKSPCGRCGHRTVSQTSVTCASCMRLAKKQVHMLLDILEKDLGIHEGVQVYFSGNEGFHIHVHDTSLAKMGSAERAELIDYVTFSGVMPQRLGIGGKLPSLPRRSEWGWRGRFAQKMTPDVRARITSNAKSGDGWLEGILRDMDIGVRMDTGVTMDIHRIFRMPGTINGKSGMIKTACDQLDSFDPYREAVAISEEPTCIRASCPVQFKMMGKKFGPYTNEYVEVPAYAAAYMICKGLACIVV